MWFESTAATRPAPAPRSGLAELEPGDTVVTRKPDHLATQLLCVRCAASSEVPPGVEPAFLH